MQQPYQTPSLSRKNETEPMPTSSSREVLFLFLNGVLDPEKERGLPLVKLAHLVELVQLVGKDFLLPLLYGACKITEKLTLSGGGKGGIEFLVCL